MINTIESKQVTYLNTGFIRAQLVRLYKEKEIALVEAVGVYLGHIAPRGLSIVNVREIFGTQEGEAMRAMKALYDQGMVIKPMTEDDDNRKRQQAVYYYDQSRSMADYEGGQNVLANQ